MKKLTPYEKGFLEGVIDTDGCITLFRKRNPKTSSRGIPKRGWYPNIRLSISNNSKELLEKVCQIIGEKKPVVAKNGKSGVNYEVRFAHSTLRWLLPQLRLIVKEKRRVYALNILKHIKKRKKQNRNGSNYEKKLEMLVNKFIEFSSS